MFGSTWGNNNQQAQPQQSSVFGQPTGFGQPSAFGGGTGAFGQPQQQQQQQPTNSIFGAGAAGGTSNAFGGGGAFGSNNHTAVNPIFGGAKPSTGFGAFGGGGTTAFGGGGGGVFGQNNATTTTGAFGQPANNTSAFGQTNTMFGKPATTTAFGATANASDPPVPPVTTGSSQQWQPAVEKDGTLTSTYQSISCAPVYKGTSFEELRVQDYAQGRKTAQAGGGAFGQTNAFGAQPASNVFGQPAQQQQQQPSVFGQPAAQQPTTGFGAFSNPSTTTAFGAPATNAFGQPQQQTSAFGGGGGGVFGQPQQQQQQQTTSVFGGGGTAFGANNAAKPAFGGTGTFGFGANNNTTHTQQPGTGLFGNTNATNNQTTSAFGGGGGGIFGNNANNAAKPSIFGQPAAQPAQNAFGGGSSLFGNTQQQQQQPAQQTNAFGGGSIFGANNNTQQQQQPATTSLFGNTNNAAPATNSLFGGGTTNNAAGGGLFGNNNNQQQQPGSLFGAKPATTGLFGAPTAANTAAPTTGLFGNTAQTQPTSTFGSGTSLFGNNNAAKPPALGQSNSMGTSLFGGGAFGTNNTNTNGTSLFGNSMGMNNSQQQQQQQGMLTASIAQPLATDLFSMLPANPNAMSLQESTKKKVPFFVDVPMRAPVPRVGLSYSPASSKLRGFGGSSSTMTVMSVHNSPGNPFHQGNLAASAIGQSRPGVLSLSRVDSPDALLRSSTPTLGSGARNSVKKLILDKKVEPGELFNKTTSRRGEKEAQAQAAASQAGKGVAPRPMDSPSPAAARGNRFAAEEEPRDGDENGEEGAYWVKPDLASLRQAGYAKLSAFPDLVVGRVGYGQIHFLEPVDLTGLAKLGALLGGVVRFEDKECSVYPDSDEVEKPPPGQGLNVRARLTLVRCWAVDKATREPIKDVSHPAAVKHLKRLKAMKETTFESFDLAKGEWVFTVEHF
ncbi:Peptidase S59 domain-containing protein [Mycena kentingensis (nom. inval.)]|nr:Peptidase S59 domain-containing protein [Mycena kentingensis (nom. inval.)]